MPVLPGSNQMSDPPMNPLSAALHHGHRHIAELVETFGPEGREKLSKIARFRHYERGDAVVEADAVPDEISFLIDGCLGMIKRLPDKRIHIVGLLMPGDLFGRLFDGPLSYGVEALSEATVLGFERAPFEALMRRNPQGERLMLVSVLDELDAAREWVLLLGGTRVSERLAGFLLILARRRLTKGARTTLPLRLKVPIRRNDLAHYLGIRPESLSRAVHRMEEEGILRIEETNIFVIEDLAGLIDASGQDLAVLEPAEDRTTR